MAHFMGADRVVRVGAVRNGRPGAMRASGKRRNAAPILYRAAPRRPTREGRALLAAGRAHALLVVPAQRRSARLAAIIHEVGRCVQWRAWRAGFHGG